MGFEGEQAVTCAKGPSSPATVTANHARGRRRSATDSPVLWSKHLDAFVLHCEGCHAKQVPCYWPLDLEFWNPHASMRRCRACHLERRRKRERLSRIIATTLPLSPRKREYPDPEAYKVALRAYNTAWHRLDRARRALALDRVA